MNLVLLHPLPLDGSIWPRSLWDIAEAVVAPTLYSLGDSLIDWGTAALDHAPAGEFVVVGNSVGGSCALEMANLAPTRVRALVLVGAKAGVRPEPVLRDEAVRVLTEEGIESAWEHYWSPLFGPSADPEVVGRAKQIALSIGVDHLVHGVRAFHNRPDRAELLATLDVPVIIVRGRHDGVPETPARSAATLRDGRFVEVNDSGHYVPLEQPDKLVSIVNEVLEAIG